MERRPATRLMDYDCARGFLNEAPVLGVPISNATGPACP